MSEKSDQIQCIVEFEVKQKMEQEFLNRFRKLQIATKMEPGCIQYDIYQEGDSEGKYILIEQFKNKDSFERHLSMEYVQEFVKNSIPELTEKFSLKALKLLTL
jgi:quinol monooxygenase YgiN